MRQGMRSMNRISRTNTNLKKIDWWSVFDPNSALIAHVSNLHISVSEVQAQRNDENC